MWIRVSDNSIDNKEAFLVTILGTIPDRRNGDFYFYRHVQNGPGVDTVSYTMVNTLKHKADYLFSPSGYVKNELNFTSMLSGT